MAMEKVAWGLTYFDQFSTYISYPSNKGSGEHSLVRAFVVRINKTRA